MLFYKKNSKKNFNNNLIQLYLEAIDNKNIKEIEFLYNNDKKK